MFKIIKEFHTEGEGRCETCWTRWPKRCSCGGMEHAEYKSENVYGDEIYLQVKCDKCAKSHQKTLHA